MSSCSDCAFYRLFFWSRSALHRCLATTKQSWVSILSKCRHCTMLRSQTWSGRCSSTLQRIDLLFLKSEITLRTLYRWQTTLMTTSIHFLRMPRIRRTRWKLLKVQSKRKYGTWSNRMIEVACLHRSTNMKRLSLDSWPSRIPTVLFRKAVECTPWSKGFPKGRWVHAKQANI